MRVARVMRFYYSIRRIRRFERLGADSWPQTPGAIVQSFSRSTAFHPALLARPGPHLFRSGASFGEAYLAHEINGRPRLPPPRRSAAVRLSRGPRFYRSFDSCLFSEGLNLSTTAGGRKPGRQMARIFSVRPPGREADGC